MGSRERRDPKYSRRGWISFGSQARRALAAVNPHRIQLSLSRRRPCIPPLPSQTQVSVVRQGRPASGATHTRSRMPHATELDCSAVWRCRCAARLTLRCQEAPWIRTENPDPPPQNPRARTPSFAFLGTLLRTLAGGNVAGEACVSQVPLTRRIFLLGRSRALTRLASSRSGEGFSRHSEKEARRWGAQRACWRQGDGLLCEPAEVLRARGDREPAAGRSVSWRCR